MKHDYPAREDETERLEALGRYRVLDGERQAKPGNIAGETTGAFSRGVGPGCAGAHFPEIHGPKGA